MCTCWLTESTYFHVRLKMLLAEPKNFRLKTNIKGKLLVFFNNAFFKN